MIHLQADAVLGLAHFLGGTLGHFQAMSRSVFVPNWHQHSNNSVRTLVGVVHHTDGRRTHKSRTTKNMSCGWCGSCITEDKSRNRPNPIRRFVVSYDPRPRPKRILAGGAGHVLFAASRKDKFIHCTKDNPRAESRALRKCSDCAQNDSQGYQRSSHYHRSKRTTKIPSQSSRTCKYRERSLISRSASHSHTKGRHCEDFAQYLTAEHS